MTACVMHSCVSPASHVDGDRVSLDGTDDGSAYGEVGAESVVRAGDGAIPPAATMGKPPPNRECGDNGKGGVSGEKGAQYCVPPRARLTLLHMPRGSRNCGLG